MPKDQIEEISELLVEYSKGNYKFQGNISDEVNELDMIISGINMLGEELQSTNVSKNYFLSIFNAVNDLIVILDGKGRLIDYNKALVETLGLDKNKIKGNKLNQIITTNSLLFDEIKKSLNGSVKSILIEDQIIKSNNDIIHGQFTCSKILDRFDNFKGYLLSIKDVTDHKKNEQLILKTILSTQQREHKRVADDLHDSLGQELSMTKLMISNLRKLNGDNPKSLELINTCTEILDCSIQHLREICFNLMPSVLSRGGLNMAISDLVKKLAIQDKVKPTFDKNPKINRLDSDLEIVIYRITQEFINNMIKHSNATELLIQLGHQEKENTVTILLKENGQGFDMKKLKNIGENRGYQNLQTKVKAFNGKLVMNSIKGEGTTTFIKFPILPYHEEY